MNSPRSMMLTAAVIASAATLLFCAGGTGSSSSPEADPAAAGHADAGTPAAQNANDPAAAAATGGGTPTYDPATAVGAVRGVPDPTNSAPIEAVANFYAELPGFDLSTFDAARKEKFLHRVNSEMCTCGCKDDTLARCLVNDPKCPTVAGLVQTVYDEVKTGR